MHIDPDVRRNCVCIPAPERVILGNADISAEKAIVCVTQHDAVVSTRRIAPADLVRLSEPRPLATGPSSLIVEYFFCGNDAFAACIGAAGDENDAAFSRDFASVADQLLGSSVSVVAGTTTGVAVFLRTAVWRRSAGTSACDLVVFLAMPMLPLGLKHQCHSPPIRPHGVVSDGLCARIALAHQPPNS